MQITEEQRKRAEANRLAAIEKRKRAASSAPVEDPWRLFRCRKISTPSSLSSLESCKPKGKEVRFKVLLEICGPTEFSVTYEPLIGVLSYSGEEHSCFRRIITDCLSSVSCLRTTETQCGRQMSVYRLHDHETVLRCLKKLSGVQLEDIPHITLSVVQKFQECVGNQWTPFWKGYFSDGQVDGLLEKLPKSLRDALLPFQWEGVRFGLRRGGRCLIADEMGLGKTIQAIAIACCFLDEGPILVVCPAVLRYSWAEELEHWLPFLLPKDIHLVFGHQDNLNNLEKSPKVVVISYTMLSRLRRSMLERKWALLIVDESHNIRCTKKKMESTETEAVIDIAAKINRIVLLSGTPSLSRPYDIYHQINILWPRLLGRDKYEFAKSYCLMKVVQDCQGKIYQDFSKGARLEELNVLLRQTVMIRRLKENVLTQLPPKRRQIIRLKLEKSDMPLKSSCLVTNMTYEDTEHLNEPVDCLPPQVDGKGENLEDLNVNYDKECEKRTPKQLSHQELGLSKLHGFREWFSNHDIVTEPKDATSSHIQVGCQKMVIFAHHLKVLDGVQELMCEKGIHFVRIDGSTLARDRQAAVEGFRLSKEAIIAIIGITAGGVGLDFSSAQNVVFLELPKTASEMLQAEDRAHRQGQTNAVNIYIFCGKDTSDEPHWLHLNKSLFRVSSMIDGIDDAVQEIKVSRVSHLDHSSNSACESPGDISIDQLNGDNAANWETQTIRLCSSTSEACGDSTSEHTKVDNSISTRTDLFQSEAQMVHDLDAEGICTLHGIVEVSASGNIHGQHCTASCDTLYEVTAEFDAMENIMRKAEIIHAVSPEDVGCGAPELLETMADSYSQAETLRFEVSQYTGRVHLYACVPGEDSKPRPLFVNFRQEDIESVVSTGHTDKGTTMQFIKENAALCNICQTFVKEWNGLRPIERNKLFGKPLQLPLSLELCYLKETLNHGTGGLLKGGSKRRVTPTTDIISHHLPENAVWKKVALRSSTSKEKEYAQAWTVSDEPLCKLCQEPCNGKLAKEPEYFEELFCNLSCFQEYRIRTSQRALREALFQIEHGVCSLCNLDCHKLVQHVRPLSIARRKKYIEKAAPILANQKKLFEKLVYEPTEGNAWHADHIIPVYKGGGECTLENMRTLCVVCHAEVTKSQRTERKFTRQRAKEQLKIIMEEFIANKRMNPNSCAADGSGEKDASEEDMLFIKVPGSAYSRRDSC